MKRNHPKKDSIFTARKTIRLKNSGKKLIARQVKALNLSVTEMQQRIAQLKNEYEHYDQAATGTINRYRSAVSQKKCLQERLGGCNYFQPSREHSELLKQISEIDASIQGGGKYWHDMRSKAETIKEELVALRRLLKKKLAEEKLQELKSRAADNERKIRSLATTVKTRMIEQFKILTCCPYCGKELQPSMAHADHIYPVCKGGRSTKKNLVYVCADCNMAKREKTVTQFLKETGLDRSKVERNLESLGKDY